MAKDGVKRPSARAAAGAFVDLTRIAYFGPGVAAAFLLGAVLAMPDAPDWSALGRIVLGGLIGFSGGFVLNDWADRTRDRLALEARIHHPDYERQLRRERPFTRTRPLAIGLVSPNAGLAFALALIAVSAGIALTFPSPHRWYILSALAFCAAAEPLYCRLKPSQGDVPVATFFHAALLGVCPAVGYLALARPDWTALGLFLWLYLWEVGFNQLYDTVDAENDRLRGVATLSTTRGLPFVARWCLAASALTSGCFLWVWWTSGFGRLAEAGLCLAGAVLLGTDLVLVLRPRLRVASAAITLHQVYVMIIVAATLADAELRWFSRA